MKPKLLYYLIVINFFSFPIFANNFKKTKIAIISLYDDGYKHIGQYSDENKQRYAKKHGYDVFIYHELLDASRPGPWSKILAIQKHLADYDWIYWSDADSLIMNTDIKLESFIDDEHDMIISKECYYGYLNTGSFLIKNSPWSHELLRRIYAQEQFIFQTSFWEQAALAHLLEVDKNLMPHLKVLHQRAINSNLEFTTAEDGWYQEGDFIIHFFGDCDKKRLMKEWSQKVLY